MTRPYAEVIGDPIAHSKSPLIHNFWLQKLGIDADYRACHVRADELEEYFTRRREDAKWLGCNVTIPHKVATLQLVDATDEVSQQVGAANTVYLAEGKLLATNTDIDGVRVAFASVPDLPSPEGCMATLFAIIGAGGAARAAGAAFKSAEITFYARDVKQAALLADLFSAGADDRFAQPLDALRSEPLPYDPKYPDGRGIRGEDQRYSYIIINASPLGMAGNPEVPVNLDCYPSDTIVFDMVYAPLETGLLREARLRGMRTIDGLSMLVGQAASAFGKFFGQSPPREYDAELRALLTA